MILKRKILHITAILLVAVSACKKVAVKPVTQPPIVKRDTDIYVVGDTYAKNGKAVATYWKNGIAVKLGDSTENSFGSSIAIDNKDVYIAGWQVDVNYNTTAVCWKNGSKISLADSSNSVARAIAVSAGNSYIAGVISGTSKPGLYWMNGTPVTIDGKPGSISLYATNIVANDVYVAGTSVLSDNTTQVATYWKNGAAIQLTNKYSYAFGMAVNGNDVYIAGDLSPDRVNRTAAYWKNGSEIQLSNGPSDAQAVVVNGTDVYVAGTNISIDGKGQLAVYWKNGVINTVRDITLISSASSIAVAGSNIYMAGAQTVSATNTTSQPVYWKNGLAFPLAHNGQALGIVVVPL